VPRPPAIVPALVAMTALQMLVSCAMFAPSVMAPRIGIDPVTLGLYATAPCVVGFLITFAGGMLAGRYGSFRVATVCGIAVFCAMGVAAWSGASATLILAGVILGFAYGPETPASSTLLFRITPPEKRPLVFSLRQTGNQSGAIIGSLCLPVLAAYDPAYGYAAIMLLALVAIVAFETLRPTYDPLVRGAASTIRLREALKVLVAQPEMRKLAIASVPTLCSSTAACEAIRSHSTGRSASEDANTAASCSARRWKPARVLTAEGSSRERCSSHSHDSESSSSSSTASRESK